MPLIRLNPFKLKSNELVGLVGSILVILAVWIFESPNTPLDKLLQDIIKPSPAIVMPSAKPSPIPLTSPYIHSQATGEAVLVTRIIDGDTIELVTGEKVRYIGIDTPEKNQDECFSQEATAKNAELVENKYVILESDIRDKDFYGRLLRYVYVDGMMVNLELVKQGYAIAISYPPDVKYQPQLQAAQKEAQEIWAGLWLTCQAISEAVE